MLFTSKKDGLYFAAVWVTVFFILVSIVLEFSFSQVAVLWGLFGLLLIGFLVWIWFGTSYRIGEEILTIRNGPFTYQLEVKDIYRIRKVKSILATPALSVDRLVLEYGKYRDVHISPKQERAFIKLLTTRNPHIQLDEKLSEI